MTSNPPNHPNAFGGYVDPSFANPGGPGDAPIIIYGYRPSFALAVLGMILFAIAFILHLSRVLYHRTYYFIPMAIGSAFEVVGYAFRYQSSQVDPYRVDFFVVQYFFIVVAPVLFSACIYVVLSILIRRLGPAYSPLGIPPRAILWIFVASDVVATVVQIVGSALIGVNESKRKDPTKPNDVLLAGLCVQVASFFVFVVLLAAFCWRARGILFGSEVAQGSSGQLTTAISREDEEKRPSRSTALRTEKRPVPISFIIALWIATIAVYLRTCYRTSETAQHNYGSRAHNVTEVEFGILEFAPIVICVYALAIWHPGWALKPERAVNTTAPVENLMS